MRWDNKLKKWIYENKTERNAFRTVRDDEWDSGLSIVEGEPKIEVHHQILLLCQAIQKKLPGCEFSILCKGEYSDKGFIVGNEYVIPEQTVTASTVEYENLTKYQNEGYNVVIHSHHNMGSFFSVTDKEYINTHFPCSILFTKDELTLATLSFKGDGIVFLLKTEDVETYVENDIELTGFENITKGTYQYKPKVKTKKEKTVPLQLFQKKDVETTVDCDTCQFKNTRSCVNCYEDTSLEDDIMFGGI